VEIGEMLVNTEFKVHVVLSYYKRRYSRSWKVVVSIPDEVIGFFFSIYLILPTVPWLSGRFIL
jgi:hypothetical protein